MIGNRNLHIRTERRLFMDEVAIYIFERIAPDKIAMISNIEMTTIETGQMKPESPLQISYDTAQELMDSLWDCGLRPSEGAGSAGSLKATENHLKDMQNLSWRLLTIIERPKKED